VSDFALNAFVIQPGIIRVGDQARLVRLDL